MSKELASNCQPPIRISHKLIFVIDLGGNFEIKIGHMISLSRSYGLHFPLIFSGVRYANQGSHFLSFPLNKYKRILLTSKLGNLAYF